MRQRDRRAQVDVERAVDLLAREALEPAGGGKRRRWRSGCPPRRPAPAGASTSAGSLRSAASARAPSSAASGSSTSARRPVRISSRAARVSARAIAWPSPPLAPVSRRWSPRSARRVRAYAAMPGSSRCSGPPASARRRSRSPLADSSRALREAPRGEDPVAVSADALQVYAGPRDPHRRRLAGRAGAARAPAGLLPAARRDLQRRPVRRARARRDRRAARRRAAPDRGRRYRPVPARGARPSSTCARRRRRARASAGRRSSNARARPRCTRLLARRAPWAAEGIDPNDRQRVVRALELLDAGELEPPEGPSQLWSAELRHPTLLARADDGARGAVRARSTRASRRCSRRGSREEVRARARGRRLGDRPQGARLRGAAGGRRGER